MSKNKQQPTSNPLDLETFNPVNAVAKALIVSLAWSTVGLPLQKQSAQPQRQSSQPSK